MILTDRAKREIRSLEASQREKAGQGAGESWLR